MADRIEDYAIVGDMRPDGHAMKNQTAR